MNAQRKQASFETSVISFEQFSNSRFTADAEIIRPIRPPKARSNNASLAKTAAYWGTIAGITLATFMSWAGLTLLAFGLFGLVPALVLNTGTAAAIIAFGGVAGAMTLADRAAGWVGKKI